MADRASSVAAIRYGLVAVGLLLAAVAAPQAVAATASVSGGVLVYQASAGETNELSVFLIEGVYHLTDSAGLNSGSGCSSGSVTAVACPAAGVTSLQIDLGDSNDTALMPTPTPTTASGADGNDSLTGGFLGDVLSGGEGQDVVDGGSGDDHLNGGAGDDVLRGGFGADTASGNDGDDSLEGGPGHADSGDVFHGGSGSDTADYSSASGGTVTLSLDGAANDGVAGEADNIGPTGDVENLVGTNIASIFGDTLLGNAGPNILTGAGGDDDLDGGAGDDTFIEAPLASGSDDFVGGIGLDTVDYSARLAPVIVDPDDNADDGDGTALELDNVASDVEGVVGGAGSDRLTASPLGSLLRGGPGGDTVLGLGGGDDLQGEAGDDTLDGGAGADELGGGNGSDTAFYASRSAPLSLDLGDPDPDGGAEDGAGDALIGLENLVGGSGDDVLIGDSAANIITGGAGDDLLEGGLGGDALVGGPGISDTADYSTRTSPVIIDLDGASADDGESGENDTIASDVEDIFGGSGADVLAGNEASNFLDGGPGADILTGLGGRDIFEGGAGADTFNGGTGNDVADYSLRSDPVMVTLDDSAGDGAAGEGDDVRTDVEDVFGGSGGDLLVGNPVSNLFAGGPGADRLSGGSGIDLLFGESGPDSLDGGADDDLFDAGADDDRLETRDGTPESDIVCGSGQDFAVADANDAPSADCEGVDTGVGPIAPPPPPPVAPPPPPPVAPPPPPPAARPTTPPRIVRCLVPNVRGKPLAAARALVRRRNCAAGKVSRAYSRKVRKGRIISQRPRAGARLARGAKVNLLVSRGARPKRR
jgi:Ca2+-binding RTX toxin-like protein